MPPQNNENPDVLIEENTDATAEMRDNVLSKEEVSETDENTITAENEIVEATGDSTMVENIEHIEKVEITGRGISTFMTYFPHLVVGLISLIALAGLIFIMYISDKKSVDPSETARSLITYLVAVFTIVIALTLTLMAFFGNMKDFKERFAMGKEILTILIGVLGTIIGFYFGSAPNENKPAAPSAFSNSNSAVNSNSATNTTTAFMGNSNSSKTPTDTQRQFAKVKEREGFENLIAGDYESSINAFQTSEDAWNGYHNTYDIARLLRKNKTQMDEPGKKKEVFGIIVSQYSYGAPTDLLEQIKAIPSQ
ncbi:MAG: DUF308 domain-containing protein [Pyrinomonadaceae bacterium]